MVKHQRRSHQRGMNANDMLDDCTSDSDSGESPSTPKHTGMQWPPQGVMNGNHQGMSHGHTMHRAASFADFGQHMNPYMPQQFGHRHSLSGGPHEYHGMPVHEQQHPVQVLHRTASMPQHSYYVTEQANPGVATMNTHHQVAHQVAPQYQVPRQQVERLPLEIPYSAPGLSGSIQSSPSSFSAASGRSPSTQEGFYTHQPTQAATYALHSASPVEQQQPMIQYSPPLSHHQNLNAPQQPLPSQAPPQTQAPPPQEQYQPPPPQPEPEGWYNGVPYQAPVEVANIGGIPTYGSVPYDIWGPKAEYEDPSMQLPSARIENM